MGIGLNRRFFLKKSLLSCLFGGMGSHLLPLPTQSEEIGDGEGLLYERGENNGVHCQVCFRVLSNLSIDIPKFIRA